MALTTHAGWALALIFTSTISTADTLRINDSSPRHNHPAGKIFTIDVTPSDNKNQLVQWVDYQGNHLGAPIRLNAKVKNSLTSPSSKPGYYGLRSAGNKEHGFSIFPATLPSSAPENSLFGMVHSDNKDPYLQGFTKTATWKTYRSSDWKHEMQQRRVQGLIELPLILEHLWSSKDHVPIGQAQLDKLQKELTRYFKADPKILYWELGLEENLGDRYNTRYYWRNLKKKIDAAHQARLASNPKIQFIYQIAGLDLPAVKDFLSQNLTEIDILSLHPYAWPEFQMPEYWLPNFLSSVKNLQKTHKTNYPIWSTEIGAPQHSQLNGGRFNFKAAVNVKGQGRAEAADFMVRTHFIALNNDVEKIIWYNYKDRENISEDPESHFGLRDFNNHPKPAYTAYITMLNHFHGAETLSHSSRNGIENYTLTYANGSCNAVWTKGSKPVNKKIASLHSKNPYATQISNVVGTPVTPKEELTISPSPLYICSRR